MTRPTRGWRGVLLAVVLGYAPYLAAVEIARFSAPGDQGRVFEVATAIAAALYGIIAGLFGYHRPHRWLPPVVLPWPFVLSGAVSVVLFRGMGFEPIAVGLLLAPIVATLVGWRGGRAIRYRSVG